MRKWLAYWASDFNGLGKELVVSDVHELDPNSAPMAQALRAAMQKVPDQENRPVVQIWVLSERPAVLSVPTTLDAANQRK